MVGRMNEERPRGVEPVVLSLNVGSSSLKFALFRFSADGEMRIADGAIDRIGLDGTRLRLRRSDGPTYERDEHFANREAAIVAAFAAMKEQHLPDPGAVGHRLVHGGPRHFLPERVDHALLASLREVVRFAPLHLPTELDAIDVVAARFPGMPQVACFDTAFHERLPEVARRLPISRALHDEGVHKYGFHGLSYEYVVTKLGAARLGRRAILAHLGNGASMTAVLDGESIDTTMGFTPTGGLMMGTRTGDLDPGVLLYLLSAGYDARRLQATVDEGSGLLGVSGTTSDMKALLERRGDDARCALAIDMFTYRIRKSIGAFVAALGGVDTLVFTGGIGEHAPPVRAECCRGLECFGIRLDAARNEASADVVSTADSPCSVRVVPTDEELMIARHTRDLARTP
jgi:acetate kinase